MGRCCPGVALGLLALAFVANNPRAEFATITNTVYDCQYDLTEEQCADCFGTELISDDGFTFLDDVYAPKDASCINSAEGCCKTEDGYEYFLMSSLANYGVGKPTQFFWCVRRRWSACRRRPVRGLPRSELGHLQRRRHRRPLDHVPIVLPRRRRRSRRIGGAAVDQ